MSIFPDCGPDPLGLYPIVDSVAWLEKLLPQGIKTIQLRIKNKPSSILAKEIKQAIEIANQFTARLFINDEWELAISCGAYGVHLGQEDLKNADIERICQAGLRLGISTHSDEEVLQAASLNPSYVAYGSIYPTVSKTLSSLPQGILQLKRVVSSLSYPVVAIGGINLERIPEVLAVGVNGVAVISAISQADDPIAMTKKLLAAVTFC